MHSSWRSRRCRALTGEKGDSQAGRCSMYDDAAAFLERHEDPRDRRVNERTRLSKAEAEELGSRFPGIPTEYLEYLRQIGWGANIRECQFKVYAEPMLAADFIGEDAAECYGPERGRVLCFGDNYSGDFSGFLPSENWAVVELWHDDGTLWRTKKTFGEYIRECMLMGPDGTDQRM